MSLIDLLTRVRTVLRAAPTWLTAIAVGVSAFADEVPGTEPSEWAVRVVAWIGAAVAIIRQVTPVTRDQRGLLAD